MANKNLFNSIQLKKPKKNVFDLTHDVKLSMNMGELVPIMNMEVVPGDKFDIGCESLIRFAPMIAPVMHRMDVSMHYFFVPNRILWNNWEEFITNQNSGLSAPYVSVNSDNFTNAELRHLNYLGLPIPTNIDLSYRANALSLSAYQCVYNEYYRDQNLINEVAWKLNDGDNSNNGDLFATRKRAWEHDYFTASLPFAQKGSSVLIPLGEVSDNAIVKSNVATELSGTPYDKDIPAGVWDAPESNIWAETQGLPVSSTPINDLRRAFRLQEWLEKNARGGTRYVESILSHFGVKSSDARLQRPEYITGTKQPVVISEVLNTTGQDGGLPQGNMAGHGISVGHGHNGSYFAEEHGYIIGIMSVLPKTAYQQGVPKHFLKNETLDYYFPTFANIGEQEVKQLEVYCDTENPDETFGYVPRYSEYKYMPSRVAGEFRTNLDYWHLGRKFSSDPGLNQQFVECDPASTLRIFAVESPDSDHLYCHVLNKVRAVRSMPYYGTPMF